MKSAELSGKGYSSRNVLGKVYSERCFRQRCIERLGLGGALPIQITSKSTERVRNGVFRTVLSATVYSACGSWQDCAVVICMYSNASL
jgi:hypothetical protein